MTSPDRTFSSFATNDAFSGLSDGNAIPLARSGVSQQAASASWKDLLPAGEQASVLDDSLWTFEDGVLQPVSGSAMSAFVEDIARLNQSELLSGTGVQLEEGVGAVSQIPEGVVFDAHEGHHHDDHPHGGASQQSAPASRRKGSVLPAAGISRFIPGIRLRIC